MRSLSLSLGALMTALLLAAPTPQALAGPPGQSLDAQAWLARIQSAARERNYQGTMVFNAGEVVASSRVAHYCVGAQTFERVEALDGQMQRVYRHNDTVHSVWPRSRVVSIEQRDAVTANPVLPEIEPRLHEHYELRALGPDRVAGRQAQVLLLKPRDELRFKQRIWVDQDTGLMLRADVLGPQGAVLESSAFSDVEIGVRPARESVTAPMKKKPDGFRVVSVTPPVRTRLETEGWVLARLPAGFYLIGCVRRAVDTVALSASTTTAVADAPALQAVYSDGLARVSIFIEPLEVGGRPRQALMTQLGATHTLMKAHGERWWVTLMGDVPVATLKAFSAALERRP
jgi:sigma-E factor negative regulatory protein RseB